MYIYVWGIYGNAKRSLLAPRLASLHPQSGVEVEGEGEDEEEEEKRLQLRILQP